MEPSSIPTPPPQAPPPAAVPFPAEPPIPEPPANHPPYAEMIYTAIEALKEKEGSSKRAIGKYIEQVYKDQLPPNHSTLLTQHLTRLKIAGMLQMVKNSYIIPRSVPIPGPGAQEPVSHTPKPRGRPRKAQTPVQNAPISAQNVPLEPQDGDNLQPQQNAEPVWAALGLADEPVQAEGSKKRRGRPKKSEKGTGSGSGRRGRPPGSGKKPGRPPKADVAGGSDVSGGPKRGPGRPPKNTTQATLIPFAPVVAAAGAGEEPVAGAEAAVGGASDAGADAGAVLGPRSRGRPKKYADEVLAAAGRGRGRGRGRGGGGRGRGRGRRGGLALWPALLRKPGAKPLGRPKGSTNASTKNAVVEELRRKLQHFQSKVQESLAVLKPHFNHESPVTAIAAIQELEELGSMDLNAPLRDETVPQQEEVQPPQPPVVPEQVPVPLQQFPPPPQQQQQPPQQQQPQPQVLQQPQPQVQPQPHPQPFQQHFPQFQLSQYQQQLPPFQQPQQPQPPHQLFQSLPPHHQQFHP